MDHLQIEEAAQILDVTPRTVYRLIKLGDLPASKQNGKLTVKRQDVESRRSSAPRAGRPSNKVLYTLMNGPYEVMEFTYREGTKHEFTVERMIDAARSPLGTVSNRGTGRDAGLAEWWGHRCIPAPRSGLDKKLRELGIEEPSRIPFNSLGLSLSDQYWIRPSGFAVQWSDVNYFDNSFGFEAGSWDDWLSNVGLSSPDNTSEGVLPKKWACRGSSRALYKGSSAWCDQQPFNEVAATAVHRLLLEDGDYVPYQLVSSSDDGQAACSCPCFVSRDEEFIPASAIFSAGNASDAVSFDGYVRELGFMGVERITALRALSKMLICDFLIANTDRHWRNFGVIRNIHTLECRPAPLFDSGNCLWHDKDESAVARQDWSFTARPFGPTPLAQLLLAEDSEWLDRAVLDEVPSAIESALEGSLWALPRRDYILGGVRNQIQLLRSAL